MKITITAEMREALRLYEAAENELRIRHADGNEHGASVWMDAVQRRARLLAGLVAEAVEQADREEARRREAEQRQRADATRPWSRPTGRRRISCFFCAAHQLITGVSRHLDEPHDGPCGRPCFGGAPIATLMSLEGEALDDYVLSHHLDRGCLHCGEERDTPCAE